MRKIAILIGLCCIGVGLYFGYIRKPEVDRGVRILPGIEFVFTRDENAADYYAKAYHSMSRRAADDRDLKSLTSQERKWFMLGTSCRRSSWYPEHSAHITDPMDAFPQLKYLRGLGRLMSEEGRAAARKGNVQKAMHVWRRVAVLGWHTESEQECITQVLVGIAIEMIAHDEFIKHYREHGNTKEVRRYENSRQRLRDRAQEFHELTDHESRDDYRRVKRIAISHKSAMWRKEACTGLTYHCVKVDPSLRQDALATVRRVASQDPDPVVRQTAANAIPYLLGQKALPE